MDQDHGGGQSRRVALVTGASSGIGLCFARQLAGRDYDLVLVARDEARLQAAALELSKGGAAVCVMAVDLSDPAGIARVSHYLQGNPVDLLVNNAGFGTKGKLIETNANVQQRMIQLHVVAVNSLTMAALPSMVARGHGGIVTVSSVASFVASARNANYCATKAYQRHFMESLSLELKGTGVVAQALCPGFTRTEFHARGRMGMGHVREFLWSDADDVVRQSLDALDRGGPPVVIPDRKWRAIVFLLRHLPRRMLGLAQHYRRG